MDLTQRIALSRTTIAPSATRQCRADRCCSCRFSS